jgi:hypothetical protein
MKIAVVGSGGLGGYFGGRLASGGEDVHFLARGPHLEALQATGLSVESVLGDFALSADQTRATADPREIGPSDVVLITVKAYDTESVSETVLPSPIRPDTVVISLQNGIDNEERIAASESVGRADASLDPFARAFALNILGRIATASGDLPEARVRLRESLRMLADLRPPWHVAESLEHLADALARGGENMQAARLWGAAEALREQAGIPLAPAEQVGYRSAVNAGRSAGPVLDFEAEWSAGRAISAEEAIRFALQETLS